jgi:hypothetical protein
VRNGKRSRVVRSDSDAEGPARVSAYPSRNRTQHERYTPGKHGGGTHEVRDVSLFRLTRLAEDGLVTRVAPRPSHQCARATDQAQSLFWL